MVSSLSCRSSISDINFYKLIKQNKWNELKAKIEKNSKFAFSRISKIPILQLSISAKEDDFTKFLIEKGALGFEYKAGNNPLCWAAQHSNADIMKLILSKSDKKYINTLDGQLYAPLHYAVGNNAKIVQLLLDAGALSDKKDQKGRTALYYSVMNVNNNLVWSLDYQKSAFLMLKACKDKKKLIAKADNNGNNSFHIAARRNNITFIKYCLNNNLVDINIINKKNGRTALHIACLVGNINIVNFLLNNNANINIKTLDKQTPLHTACVWGYGNKEIIDSLIKRKIDINAIDKNGKTALDYAILNNKKQLIKILKKDGGHTGCNTPPPSERSFSEKSE